eukprot:947730-Pleurochrysis_carterae.AAC.1
MRVEGHGAATARVGGGAARAQPAPAGGRDRPPAGAGIRRYPRPELGIHPMAETLDSERGPRMAAGACDRRQ